LVVLVTIALTFAAGLYIGSVGVIDPIGAKPWYVAQIMNSPAVVLIGNHVAQRQIQAAEAIKLAPSAAEQAAARQRERETVYHVFGRPGEVGQIYTSIAGLLNLLCIVNAMYLVHTRHNSTSGG
jgi:hypothetical protein